MRVKLILAGWAISFFLASFCWLWAQDLSVPAVSNGVAAPAVSADPSPSANIPDQSKAVPVSQTSSVKTAEPKEETELAEDDFLLNGVPYAKVLYLEGNVWIRRPTDTTFHLLTEDELIPVGSVIYTGINGILDFASGPGMATRMTPGTLIRVAELPQPASPTPEVCKIGLKRGTVFSALGREDNHALDYEVRTPIGVAGARGTMFATAVEAGQAQISMLHGTVNFETGDHQTSQITAGQSQQISGLAGGKYEFKPRQAINPSKSAEFFNHAGGLLEHASGSGVVRRGLGPDVAKTLHEHGYNLPAATQQRFQNAAKAHYHPRSASKGTPTSRPSPGEKPSKINSANLHPKPTDRQIKTEPTHLTPAEKETWKPKRSAQASKHRGKKWSD